MALLCAGSHAQQHYNSQSPNWLAAVGRLSVPSQQWIAGDWQHRTEHCSATVLHRDSASRAQYLLSAWHCVEHYRDLSHDIRFQLPGSEALHKARLVTSGGSMEADWALLKLQRPLPLADQNWTNLAYGNTSDEHQFMTMAGYSSGPTFPEGQAPLSYHSGCRMLSAETARVATNCFARKGASGGPVVIDLGGRPHLIGVVSGSDRQGRSYFAPIDLFAAVLRQYL